MSQPVVDALVGFVVIFVGIPAGWVGIYWMYRKVRRA